MAVPLHIIESNLEQAQRNLPGLEESMRMRAGLIRAGIAKDPARSTTDDYTYRHKGQQWHCRVCVTPQGVQANALVWWVHGPKGYGNQALDALLPRKNGLQALHFDSHLFGRWGKRSPLMGVQITNMIGFFKRYPMPPLKRVHRFYPAQPDFAAALDEGLLLARRNGKHILSCDTFKDNDLLSNEEKELWRIVRKASRSDVMA
ncbi:MAG: hypothetical protein ABI599_04610 [Flavobacteriales bacterium]